MKKFLHRLSVVLIFAAVVQFVLCGIFKAELVISTFFLVYGLLTILLAVILFFGFYFADTTEK